jgi:uncharacterized protein YdeI (YjbR/CyaY-like superfamily)
VTPFHEELLCDFTECGLAFPLTNRVIGLSSTGRVTLIRTSSVQTSSLLGHAGRVMYYLAMRNDTSPQRLEPEDREEWRAWLENNHDTSTGVSVVTRKKNSPGKGVTYEEAVEEAIAFGWIDSRVNKLDEKSFLQLYTPRKPGSIWSKSNKARVARLTEQDRMAPSGVEKVAAAKRDGSWSRLDRVEAGRIPADLRLAMRAEPPAEKNFKALPVSVKKQVIFWVESARRPDTRETRIMKVVEAALAGHGPWDDRA